MWTTPTTASRVRTLPGTIAMLRGVKAVGQFDAATPDGALKNLEWYVRSMAVITGTPLFEFDLSGVQPSGEARRRAGSVTEDLESERIALEEQVNALRAFERTYRMRLREYIATQLTNFDSLASTPSVVADLPDAPALQPLHELPSAPPQQAPPATA